MFGLQLEQLVLKLNMVGFEFRVNINTKGYSIYLLNKKANTNYGKITHL